MGRTWAPNNPLYPTATASGTAHSGHILWPWPHSFMNSFDALAHYVGGDQCQLLIGIVWGVVTGSTARPFYKGNILITFLYNFFNLVLDYFRYSVFS